MLDLRRLAAAPLICVLACTATGEVAVEADVPVVDGELADQAAPTIAPRPPRPAIVGRTVASHLGGGHVAQCDDRPAALELIPVSGDAYPTRGRVMIEQGGRTFDLPLRETRHDVVVVGNMAQTTVIQVFHNPTTGPVAGLYSHALPPGAAVDDYWIRLAGREVHGVMKPITEARELHARARAAGHVAAPQKQPWANLFTQTIDVPAGATVEVELRQVQPLRREGDRYALELPMTFSSTGNPYAGSICSPVDVQVTIEGVPVTDLRANYHALTVETTRDRTRLELARGVPRPNHDLELSWQIAGLEPRVRLIAEETDDGGYFTLTIEPPRADAPMQVRPRELVFALDTSTSLQGFDTADDVIRRALVTMGPDDTFQIVRLGAGRPLAPAPLPNTVANVARAVAFLAKMEGDDGPPTLAGVTAALARKADPERLRVVLFLTDGFLGEEAAVLDELARRRGDARLFTLALGSPRNPHVLAGIARIGRGAALQVGPDERWVIADRLREYIGAPIWTDLEIDWGPLAVADVVPATLPDLFAGQPVVVYGRFTGVPTGAATLRGKRGGVAVEVPLELDHLDIRDTRGGLRAMWARRQVDALLAYPNTTSVPDAKTVAAVTELAIAHRVITAYTGLVAIETRAETRADGSVRSVQFPVAPPGVASGREETIGASEIRLGGSGYGVGGPFGGRSIRVPTVRQARAEVTGALDKDIVRRIVRAHINEVRDCYEIGLARDRNLKGRISVKFVIEGNGKVRSAEVAGDDIPDRIVAPCIVKAVRRWTFPKPEGGGLVTVVYPFVLEPG